MSAKVKDISKAEQKISRKNTKKTTQDERIIQFSKNTEQELISKPIADDLSEESDLSEISSIEEIETIVPTSSSVIFPSFVVPPSKNSSTIYKLIAKPNRNAQIPAGFLLAASSFLSKRASEEDTRICKLGKYEATFEKRLILRHNNEESVFEPASVRIFLNALNEKDNEERVQAALSKMAALHQKVKQESSTLC